MQNGSEAVCGKVASVWSLEEVSERQAGRQASRPRESTDPRHASEFVKSKKQSNRYHSFAQLAQVMWFAWNQGTESAGSCPLADGRENELQCLLFAFQKETNKNHSHQGTSLSSTSTPLKMKCSYRSSRVVCLKTETRGFVCTSVYVYISVCLNFPSPAITTGIAQFPSVYPSPNSPPALYLWIWWSTRKTCSCV